MWLLFGISGPKLKHGSEKGFDAVRQINQDGLDIIKRWEGLYLQAYHGAADRPGLLTVGYGHTDAAGPPSVTLGMKISQNEAEQILRSDLGKCEAAVSRLVKAPLTDNQFAALVSFTFNCGEGALKNSSLLRKLNDGDYNSIPSELMKWTRANGVQVKGLVNRRAAEAGLWAKGAYVSSQFVEPEEKKETILTSLAKPETIGTIVSTVTGASTAVGGLGGPVGYAVAIVIFIGGCIAAYWAVKHIRERGT